MLLVELCRGASDRAGDTTLIDPITTFAAWRST
jgi:hypothetical protein